MMRQVSLTLRPFPDPNQLVRSGRTFTSAPMSGNNRVWDFPVIPVLTLERPLFGETDIRAMRLAARQHPTAKGLRWPTLKIQNV